MGKVAITCQRCLMLLASTANTSYGNTSDDIFYAQFFSGTASSNVRTNNLSLNCEPCRLNEESTLYGLTLGYFFTPNMSVELGYVDLGKIFEFSSATDQLSQDSYGLTLTESIYWFPTRQLAVYGRFGAIFWNSDISYHSDSASSQTNSDSDIELSLGLGVAYHINQRWALGLEWQQFNKIGDSSIAFVREDKIETVDADVHGLSMGIRYLFNTEAH